jgi:hypothetical protein
LVFNTTFFQQYFNSFILLILLFFVFFPFILMSLNVVFWNGSTWREFEAWFYGIVSVDLSTSGKSLKNFITLNCILSTPCHRWKLNFRGCRHWLCVQHFNQLPDYHSHDRLSWPWQIIMTMTDYHGCATSLYL